MGELLKKYVSADSPLGQNGTLMVIAAAALIIILAIVGKLLPKLPPYCRAEKLMTDAELAFWRVLKTAVPEGCVIFSKVRLIDLLEITAKRNSRAYFSALGPVVAKHVDFAICRESDSGILCVIELDDRSHQRKDRRKRDEFLNDVLDRVGLPIVHVPVARHYDMEELRAMIAGRIMQ